MEHMNEKNNMSAVLQSKEGEPTFERLSGEEAKEIYGGCANCSKNPMVYLFRMVFEASQKVTPTDK